MIFQDRVSLFNSPGCPETSFVDQSGLEFTRDLSTSASQVLRLRAPITTIQARAHVLSTMLQHFVSNLREKQAIVHSHQEAAKNRANQYQPAGHTLVLSGDSQFYSHLRLKDLPAISSKQHHSTKAGKVLQEKLNILK